MATLGIIGLVILCFRLMIFAVVLMIRIAYVMIVVPLELINAARQVGGVPFEKRIVRAWDAFVGKTEPSNYVPVYDPDFGNESAVRNTQPAAQVPTGEPSRNEKDCARALSDLGFPKKQSAAVARQVAFELGPNAELNVMVKRALQIAKTMG